jgi:cellulose synthase/poly-beta-1,6-N-acetylglucosamine synthase-like glycosyltransferase
VIKKTEEKLCPECWDQHFECDYFIAIDVDSIIDPNALQKLVKPFLEETNKRVIAAGGVIRLPIRVLLRWPFSRNNVPDKFLPRCQVNEYNRAFLMGRLAWSRLDGLLIISGAGNVRQRDRNCCGGYAPKQLAKIWS